MSTFSNRDVRGRNQVTLTAALVPGLTPAEIAFYRAIEARTGAFIEAMMSRGKRPVMIDPDERMERAAWLRWAQQYL